MCKDREACFIWGGGRLPEEMEHGLKGESISCCSANRGFSFPHLRRGPLKIPAPSSNLETAQQEGTMLQSNQQ